MAKDERQRDRRLRRQKMRGEGQGEGQADLRENAGDAQMLAAPKAEDAVTPSEESTDSLASGWDDLAPAQSGESPNIEPVAAGPAAVAEILAAPSMAASDDHPADDDDAPTPSPFFAGHAPGFQGATEADPGPTDESFGDQAEQQFATHGYRAEPRWTREPALLALLLVALIVLALDTYFTLRLNGLSDRLSAAAAKPAPTAMAGGERPWVGVDSIRTAAFANGGQPVTTVHIVNSGRDPAYDLRSNTVGSLRSAATPAPQIPAQKGPLATTGMLLPNTGGNLTFFANTRALTPQEAGSVRSGQFVLWLAGRLDYKDAAGHVHLTNFRYRYNPSLNSFVAAPDGNSAN